MERIEGESFWSRSPAFADEFVGGETLEGLQPTAVIVGGDRVAGFEPVGHLAPRDTRTMGESLAARTAHPKGRRLSDFICA